MTLLGLFITLVVWGLIFYVLYWGWNEIALPEPFYKIGKVILVVAVVFVLIGIFTGSITAFPFIANLGIK